MKPLRDLFAKSCKRTCEGASGAALSHVGCLTAPALSGVFGGTLSHSFMMATMYVTSPLVAMAITWGIDRYRGVKTTTIKLLSSAAIALAVSFAINQFSHNEHQEWFDSQTPEMQAMLEKNAKDLGMSLDEYVESFCFTPNTNNKNTPRP